MTVTVGGTAPVQQPAQQQPAQQQPAQQQPAAVTFADTVTKMKAPAVNNTLTDLKNDKATKDALIGEIKKLPEYLSLTDDEKGLINPLLDADKAEIDVTNKTITFSNGTDSFVVKIVKGKLDVELAKTTVIADTPAFKKAVIDAVKLLPAYTGSAANVKTQLDASLTAANAKVDIANSKVIFDDPTYAIEVKITIAT